MSEARVRLRLAGEPDVVELPSRDDGARVPLPGPSVAVVAAHEGAVRAAAELAARLADATDATGAAGSPVLRASVRARPGASRTEHPGEIVLHASADALEAAIDGALAEVPAGAGLRVVVGAPFVALYRARVSILVTGGVSRVAWEPSLRAMADRFDVLLPEARPGFARALRARLLAR